MSEFLKAMGLETEHRHDRLTFETDGSGNVLFVGYTADEIAQVLATYREHVALIIAQAQSAQQNSDAVRYTPEPGYADERDLRS